MTRILLWASAALVLPLAAQAASFTSDFDSGADGWTTTGGVQTFASTGGNPGGHLNIVDGVGTIMFVERAFSEALSLLDGGELSFDFVEKENPHSNFSDAGIVRLYSQNSGSVATADLIAGDPGTDWEEYSRVLSASNWGIDDADWADFISAIFEIEIVVESGSRVSETVGFDNFSVDLAPAPIPLPASLPLLAVGAAGLFGLRKLGRSKTDA